MDWFLIVYLYSTSDVLIIDHPTKESCQQYSKEFKEIYFDLKDIKSLECVEGEFIDDSIVTKHGKTKEN